jgi:hypothetical protein
VPARIFKVLTVIFLAAAIGAVAFSVQATLRAGAIQGPGALLVASENEVWLSVDQALWRIGADGRLRDQRPVSELGLPRAPANLVHGPRGQIVATVRDDPTLYLLGAATARVTDKRHLQWPAALAQHGGRAINLAFDNHGRVAVATGGGDAVVLFDEEGRFLARTAVGLYEFTNGLWWTAQGLWTTDTNRFTLRLLDANTLQELQTVALGRADGGGFLGPARARRDPSPDRAMAALIRFEGNMNDGQVTLVSADVRVRDLPMSQRLQPRDLDWLGDDMLATDGRSFAVLRWSAQGRIEPPFGDASVQQALHALVAHRDALQERHQRWIGAAIGGLLAALLCAALASWALQRQRPQAALDLSALGTPQVDRRTLMRLQWRATGWLMMAGLPVMVLAVLPPRWLKQTLGEHAMTVVIGIALLAVVSLLLSLPLLKRHTQRTAAQPEFEPVFNLVAMRLLKREALQLSSLLRPGEQVLETFSARPGMSWWVMTNQRLLNFSASLFEQRLLAAHELGDVVAVSNSPGTVAQTKRWKRIVAPTGWIEIGFRHRQPLETDVGSAALASRMAQRLGALSNQPRPALAAAEATPAPSIRLDAKAWRRVLASVLLPGSGHWMQRRGGEAIVLLCVWVGTVVFVTGPMLWTLVEPFTAIPARTAIYTALWHGALSLLAAADVWRTERAVNR